MASVLNEEDCPQGVSTNDVVNLIVRTLLSRVLAGEIYCPLVVKSNSDVMKYTSPYVSRQRYSCSSYFGAYLHPMKTLVFRPLLSSRRGFMYGSSPSRYPFYRK